MCSNMVARLPRSGSDILSNFRNNVQSIKELKKLNVFVTETLGQAEKNVQDVVKRRDGGVSLSDVDGLTFAVKDNLCTKGVLTTCSSEFLRNYCPPYNATAVQLLQDSGAVMLGKTNMDEFGMGSSTLYSCHGPTINPWSQSARICSDVMKNVLNEDEKEGEGEDWVVCGGSSGGSAAAVATGMCDFALGSDTGGSVRLPASFCGVVGLKPTYGRVSRYGLIHLASSMDTVGVLASHVEIAASVLDIISGSDVRDSTSVKMKYDSCSENVQTNDLKELLGSIRVGVPKDIEVPELNPQCKSLWLSVAGELVTEGSIVTDVSIPHFKYGVPCYNIINCAEVTSNMAKYSGLIFGRTSESASVETVDELFTRNRVSGFGPVVQHRIIAGMYFLSYHGRHHYEKALRVRQMMYEDFKSVFCDKSPDSVDVLLTPVTLCSAPSQNTMRDMGPVESSIYDTYTTPVNLSGLPAISVPVGVCGNGLPLGVQVIGKWMDERTMIKVARAIELICSKKTLL